MESEIGEGEEDDHAGLPEEQRQQMNISDGMIRVSAGLEDVDDLIADFDAALELI